MKFCFFKSLSHLILMSRCSVFEFDPKLFNLSCTSLLYMRNLDDKILLFQTSWMRFFSQRSSWSPLGSEFISSSVEDKVIFFFFILFQDIGQHFHRQTIPERDNLLSGSSARVESVYQCAQSSYSFKVKINNFLLIVRLRYFQQCTNSSQWLIPGLLLNFNRMETAEARQILVRQTRKFSIPVFFR